VNATCPSCGETVNVSEVGGMAYLERHDRPNGGKCYYSDKPVTRADVSGKRAAKKTTTRKRAAKKAAKK
jgi:hypothetical protein